MEKTHRRSLRLVIRHRPGEHNRNELLFQTEDEQHMFVAWRKLNALGVDFQMSLDELLGIAMELGAPATLAQWTYMGTLSWQHTLFERPD